MEIRQFQYAYVNFPDVFCGPWALTRSFGMLHISTMGQYKYGAKDEGTDYLWSPVMYHVGTGAKPVGDNVV